MGTIHNKFKTCEVYAEKITIENEGKYYIRFQRRGPILGTGDRVHIRSELENKLVGPFRVLKKTLIQSW